MTSLAVKSTLTVLASAALIAASHSPSAVTRQLVISAVFKRAWLTIYLRFVLLVLFSKARWLSLPALADLPQIFDELGDLLIRQHGPPTRHQRGFVDRKAAVLDRVEQFVVGRIAHALAVGVIARLR